MLALIDGDIITYSVGFVTQEEPVETAYLRADEFISNILTATDADDYKVFLSDSKENNFRYKVNSEYKANRTQEKPIHYDAIKEYLIVSHTAKIAHGMEADDAMAINQAKDIPSKYSYSSPTIIATIDKDLDQIEGLHYRWPIYRKGEIVKEARVYTVDSDEGIRYFWKQMIVGDRSDNIRGIDGLGEKKTDKLFEGVPTQHLFEVVAEQYKNQWGDKWEEEMVRNSKLLWIKRSDEENELTPTEISLREAQ